MSGSTDTLVLREARSDEAEQLFLIQRAASVVGFAHVFPPERYPFPDEDVRALWRDAFADPGAEIVVAEVDGRAVGVCRTRPGWLDNLYVLPERWGSGVGSALHDDAVARLRARGCAVAHLWTLEANDRARRFYEQRGWRPNGDTRVVPFPPNPLDVGYSLTLTD